MGKKMKLSLDNLKVQSFVTSLDSKHERNVKGRGCIYGSHWTGFFGCSDACDTGYECGGGGGSNEKASCECELRA